MPICRKCHTSNTIGSWEVRKRDFLRVFKYLHENGHKLSREDKEFLKFILEKTDLNKEFNKIL